MATQNGRPFEKGDVVHVSWMTASAHGGAASDVARVAGVSKDGRLQLEGFDHAGWIIPSHDYRSGGYAVRTATPEERMILLQREEIAHLKDWVEAQFAVIDAQQASMHQVFMPYVVAPDGRTFFEHFEADPRRLLTA